MKTIHTRIRVLAMAALMLVAAGATAQQVITPTAVLSSTPVEDAPIDAINGVGLTDVGSDGDVTNDTHDNNGNADTMWLVQPNPDKAGETNHWLVLDLTGGGLTNVSAALVWNHNQNSFTRLGVKTMDISATATGTSVNDATGWTGTTSVSLTQGSGAAGEPAQTLAVSFSDVRFIRFGNFETFSTAGQAWAGGVGLSEVRFLDAPPVVATPGTLIYGK